MKLATIRIDGSTRAVRVDGDTHTLVDGVADVGTLLRDPAWREVAAQASGPQHAAADADFAPLVPTPGKVLCVGANYREHIAEMGADVPEHPTLFAKFAESLIGASDDIDLPPEDEAIDWEAELAIVIGTPGRRIPEDRATEHIAGYAVLNDASMRSYQMRTPQWLQGKMWEGSTPFGPYLVTSDEFSPADAAVTTTVDGDLVQDGSTSDLVFDPRQVVAYVSTIITLRPGDVIATGTPSGVGFARNPQRFLTDGSVLETAIDGLGAQRNRAVRTRA